MVFCNFKYFNGANTDKLVTILILIDGFLQYNCSRAYFYCRRHNPYFNRWFSAILSNTNYKVSLDTVTILILIDGFLQFKEIKVSFEFTYSHNPYFNRWFSAIEDIVNINGFFELCHNPYFNRWFSAIPIHCVFDMFWSSHNPYFNRWFSAIIWAPYIHHGVRCHNPYFNRWFSAIQVIYGVVIAVIVVTILILIDGFLQ